MSTNRYCEPEARIGSSISSDSIKIQKYGILYKLDRIISVVLQKKYEDQLKKNQQQDGLEQQQPTKMKTGTQKTVKEKTAPKQPMKDKNSMVIRGVTFYKAEEESYKEEEEEDKKGKGKSKSDVSM